MERQAKVTSRTRCLFSVVSEAQRRIRNRQMFFSEDRRIMCPPVSAERPFLPCLHRFSDGAKETTATLQQRIHLTPHLRSQSVCVTSLLSETIPQTAFAKRADDWCHRRDRVGFDFRLSANRRACMAVTNRTAGGNRRPRSRECALHLENSALYFDKNDIFCSLYSSLCRAKKNPFCQNISECCRLSAKI